MIVRKFKQSDANQVTSIIRKNLLEVNIKDYPKKVVENLAKEYTPEWIIKTSKNSSILVVVSGNKIVGTGRFENGCIYDVFVDSSMHGKGIGSLIMEKLEKIAKKQGYSEVSLPASKTAVEFYKRLGYKLMDEKKKESLMMKKVIK